MPLKASPQGLGRPGGSTSLSPDSVLACSMSTYSAIVFSPQLSGDDSNIPGMGRSATRELGRQRSRVYVNASLTPCAWALSGHALLSRIYVETVRRRRPRKPLVSEQKPSLRRVGTAHQAGRIAAAGSVGGAHPTR